MKLALLLLLLLVPLVAAFDYLTGENKEVYFYCVNASDGVLLGSTAHLKVRNESGVFYVMNDMPSPEAGVFMHNISNLSRGHCYSFQLNCTADDAFNIEWGTLCTETNITTSGASNIASVGGMVVASGLFVYLAQYFIHIPMLMYGMIILAQVFLSGAIYVGLKWAEAAGAVAAVTGIMNLAFWSMIVILVLSATGFFWFGVHNTIAWMVGKKTKGLV